MELIKTFDQLKKEDAAIAGGKGASLGEMTQAGIPVPPGFVILADTFEKFLIETDLNVEIDSILHSVNHQEIHTVDTASEKIQGLILNAEMPADIKVEIEKYFVALGAEFVAVRSSATAEDGAEHAWAGQLDSYLNTTEKDLIEKVRRCWASLFTPRAIFYRFEKGLHDTKISVAVVVQKMVNSEMAGIAFSVHPVTEDRNQLIIEAGYGLGEAVVSGQVTPNSYVVEKEPRRIIDKNYSNQGRGLFRRPEGGNDWHEIAEEQGAMQVLSDEQIMELSNIILNIESHYGFPCDIEWAYELGHFYVVQSRPITTLSQEIEPDERWELIAKDYNSYYLRSYIWTSGINRGGEIVKELNKISDALAIQSKNAEIEYLCKPAKWKEMHEIFASVLKKDIKLLGKIIKETNAYAEKAMVRGREICDYDLHSKTDQELVTYLKELSSLQMGIYSYGVLLPLLDLNDQQFVEKNIKDFLLSKISAEKMDDYFLAITTPKEETFALRQEKSLLQLSIKCEKDPVLKRVITDNDPEKALEIIKLEHKQFFAELQEHTRQYCWVYYSFVGPAYKEKDFLSFIKENISDEKISCVDKLGNIDIERNGLLEKKIEIVKELKPDAFNKELLNIAGTFVWAKPTRKDYQSQLYFYIIDGVLTEIATRLNITIKQALSCPFDDLEKGLINKALDINKLDLIYKHHVVVPKDGEVKLFYGESLGEITNQIKREEIKDYSDLEQLRGTVARKGFARGVVRIINKPEDMGKMEQGDVLVSVATTPSIVPAMKKASAIITDEGGITCHAAIVSRELGTPCVIGLKIATQVLKDGDTVEVDADNGVVRIIK